MDSTSADAENSCAGLKRSAQPRLRGSFPHWRGEYLEQTLRRALCLFFFSPFFVAVTTR